MPQPLEYLVEDTAARHGRLRVGTAASFIQSDDEAAVLELAAETRAAGLGLARIAPTVLISTAPPRETAQVLRGLGLSPSVEESAARSGPAPTHHQRPRQRPARLHGAADRARRGRRRRPAGRPAERPGRATNGSHPGTGSGSGEAATQLGLETLQRAIRLKQPVSMNVVDSQGNSSLETVVPLSVGGGRVRVFDPAKETERVLSIHRIIDIEAAEDLRQ